MSDPCRLVFEGPADLLRDLSPILRAEGVALVSVCVDGAAGDPGHGRETRSRLILTVEPPASARSIDSAVSRFAERAQARASLRVDSRPVRR